MAELSQPMRRVLAVLSDTIEPMSGRRLATLTGMSPTTTNKALTGLSDLQAVTATRRGRAVHWQTTLTAERLLVTADGQRATRSALVLTALPLEYVAVRTRLDNGDELRAPNGVRYLKSTASGLHVRWTVYVYEIGMGNAAAASLIGHAIDEFDIDLVLFVGVAGGLKPDDQRHGDVVIANHVYNAHSGKHGTDADGQPTFQSRPTGRDTTHELEQLARQLARTPGRGSSGERRNEPRISVAPIASTEAVVANERSQLYERIRNGLNNCVAVDMESFGTYEAAYRNRVPAVAVRGISDLVGDKNADADIERQPIAARNAAHVAVELLVQADPDDVPPRRLSPVTLPEPDTGSARTLPPHAQLWESRLRARSPKLAEAAIEELTSSAATPLATWISRMLNRPTAWLRADTTGDGWALVGVLAEANGASTAARAYERAAQLAREDGQIALAATHRLRAALSVRVEGDDAARTAAIRSALEVLDLSDCPQLRPLVEFHVATTQLASGQVLEAAVSALLCLGHDPALVGLDSAHRMETSESVAIVPLPDDVRAALAASVLLSVSVVHLLAEDGDSAQRMAQAALELVPHSTTAQLRREQAILTRLHSQSAPSALEDTGDVLHRVEHNALAVRRARQQWGGSTAEALALAGRARIEAGDAAGALRLLRAAPHGQATAAEAKSDDVRQVATMAALISGENELAIHLAATLTNNVEAHLMRAAAFAQSSGMRSEAITSYRRAVELADDNAHYLERALLGLARLGQPVDGTGANTLTKKLQQLREHNHQAADLVLGTAALSSGDYNLALDLARRHRTVLRAVELETDALMAAGRAAEGVERLDSFGRDRGDNTVRVQAMMLAGQAELYETVVRIADAVIGACDGELRRLAREAKAEAGARTQQWDDVDLQARRLLEEVDHADPELAAERTARYRWIRAEALFHRRKFAVALDVVARSTPLPVTHRRQVLLVLAIAQAITVESSDNLPDEVFDWILTISAAWVKDEQIGAEAINLVLRLPAVYSDERLMRARALLENYFTIHEDKARVERIDFGSDPNNPDELDLTPLIDRLRSQFEPRAEALGDIVTKLWLGRLPGGLLADITRRSYAEALIKQTLGCYVVCDAPSSPAAAEHRAARGRAAREALRLGRVVVDTSALIVGNKLGVPRAHLTALFQQVMLPVSLRDDVYNAHASLALRSDTTMGWDPSAHRPTITRYSEDVVRGWADDADGLRRDLALLSIQPDVRGAERAIWNSALLLAKESGTPLWADDVALHTVAHHEGIPVFGTLDLLDAAHDEHRVKAPSAEELRTALASARVVDLPMAKSWAACAQDDGWDPHGYTALSIGRPAAWADQAASFEQYRNLMRTLVNQFPRADSVDRITGWAHAAANGIAWSTPPSARPKVVGILLAWTALNTEPMLDTTTIINSSAVRGDHEEDIPENGGQTLNALLTIAASVQSSAFPDGDGIHQVVTALADTIRTVSDGITTAAVLARVLSQLDDELRARAMTAFLSSPAAPM